MIAYDITDSAKKHRYLVCRKWDTDRLLCLFVGLNPATIDDAEKSPTLRRMIAIAKERGCGGVYMANLFSLVTANPKDLDADDNEEQNIDVISRILPEIKDVLFAWGAFREARSRGEKLALLIPNAMCLGHNADGSPKHPLYIKGDTIMMPYEASK